MTDATRTPNLQDNFTQALEIAALLDRARALKAPVSAGITAFHRGDNTWSVGLKPAGFVGDGASLRLKADDARAVLAHLDGASAPADRAIAAALKIQLDGIDRLAPDLAARDEARAADAARRAAHRARCTHLRVVSR